MAKLATLLYGWTFRRSLKSSYFAFFARPIMGFLGKIVSRAEARNEHPYQLIAKRFFGLSVGRMSYGVLQLCGQHIESVGAFSSIAPGLKVIGAEHPVNWVSTHPFLMYKSRGYTRENWPLDERTLRRNAKVIIGNDVWIGEDVSILRGVTIGDGAIVGACSLVTKDVEPFAVVVGVPARFLRYRFPEHVRSGIAHSRWWEWSDDKVKVSLDSFYDLEWFVRDHGSDF